MADHVHVWGPPWVGISQNYVAGNRVYPCTVKGCDVVHHEGDVSAALPVITRAITDRVRALHGQSVHSLVRCACGQIAPCPTAREMEAIDAEMGVER